MFDSAVNLAREHSNEICSCAVRLIQEKKISSYQERDPAVLAEHLLPALEMELYYLETNDTSRWEGYVERAVRERIERGVSYSDVILVGQLLVEALRQFFHRELTILVNSNTALIMDGRPQLAHKVLERLERRLVGLTAIATAVGVTTGLNAEKKRITT